ncbi:MAG: hypothetical protein M3O61_16145, partial [Gemmatimonadota bacterium]|nr:hypothetical protein [Gemmatimonadota bacterium]
MSGRHAGLRAEGAGEMRLVSKAHRGSQFAQRSLWILPEGRTSASDAPTAKEGERRVAERLTESLG